MAQVAMIQNRPYLQTVQGGVVFQDKESMTMPQIQAGIKQMSEEEFISFCLTLPGAMKKEELASKYQTTLEDVACKLHRAVLQSPDIELTPVSIEFFKLGGMLNRSEFIAGELSYPEASLLEEIESTYILREWTPGDYPEDQDAFCPTVNDLAWFVDKYNSTPWAEFEVWYAAVGKILGDEREQYAAAIKRVGGPDITKPSGNSELLGSYQAILKVALQDRMRIDNYVQEVPESSRKLSLLMERMPAGFYEAHNAFEESFLTAEQIEQRHNAMGGTDGAMNDGLLHDWEAEVDAEVKEGK